MFSSKITTRCLTGVFAEAADRYTAAGTVAGTGTASECLTGRGLACETAVTVTVSPAATIARLATSA